MGEEQKGGCPKALPVSRLDMQPPNVSVMNTMDKQRRQQQIWERGNDWMKTLKTSPKMRPTDNIWWQHNRVWENSHHQAESTNIARGSTNISSIEWICRMKFMWTIWPIRMKSSKYRHFVNRKMPKRQSAPVILCEKNETKCFNSREFGAKWCGWFNKIFTQHGGTL